MEKRKYLKWKGRDTCNGKAETSAMDQIQTPVMERWIDTKERRINLPCESEDPWNEKVNGGKDLVRGGVATSGNGWKISA